MPSCKDYKKNKTLNPYLEDIADVDSKLKDEIDQNKKDLSELSDYTVLLTEVIKGIGGGAFSENDIVTTPNHRTIGAASTTTQVLGTLTDSSGDTYTTSAATTIFAPDTSYTIKNTPNDLSIVLTDDVDTASNEKITLTNTNGTDAGAIALTASAGGIKIAQAATKALEFTRGFYDPSLIEEISATPDRDLTSAVVNTTVICSTAITSGTIKLPQATTDNKGLVIKIMFQESSACNISLAESGTSTFRAGRITLGKSQGYNAGYAGNENVVFSIITSNIAKTIVLDSASATKGGGGVGSSYIFTYYGVDSTTGNGKIFVEGYGLTTATPAITPDCTSSTGFS